MITPAVHIYHMQELIQNADDAGATVVRFYIDGRNHLPRCWPESDSKEFMDQGAALIAANDAVFTEKDWKGIQQLQDSVKAEDPFNVGKFGIGFNAVYHITGVVILYPGGSYFLHFKYTMYVCGIIVTLWQ